MPSHSPQANSQPDWDGRRLRVNAAPGSVLTIAIDGCRFIDLMANQDGLAELGLPVAPSGNAALGIQIATPEHGSTIEHAFRIEMHVAGVLPASAESSPLQPLAAIEKLVPASAEPMRREVAIVVPVYNAPEDVERCLNSVLASTSGPSRLIVIDDASTDTRVASLLDRYRGLAGVEIFANPKNLGFTATANRGISMANGSDVVLLNADTEVAANWLTGLRRALHSSDDIATVTAVSDNAGAFSVPELEQENPFPDAWSFAETALGLWQNAGLAYPQLPTGNGFCMLIRREVIERIGAFDVEAFPQGYGEENDFCQRACAAGYRHLIAGNVLVRHARSRSFGHERREVLGRAGMQMLRERWPRYEEDVGATLFSYERRVLDWRVRRIYADAATRAPRPRVLCLGFDGEKCASSRYDMPMFNQTASRFELRRADKDAIESSDSLDATTPAAWLQRHAIDLIVIHAPVETPVSLALESQARRLGIPLLKSIDGNFPEAHVIDARFALHKSFPGSAA